MKGRRAREREQNRFDPGADGTVRTKEDKTVCFSLCCFTCPQHFYGAVGRWGFLLPGEKGTMNEKNEKKSRARSWSPVQKLCLMGVLCAISILLVALIHIPIIPMVPDLVYDPADISILIGTFLFGPWAGLGMTVVVSLIQGFTVSARSGIVGIIMHIFATGSFAVVVGLIYRKKRTFLRSAAATGAGILTMIAVMIPLNLIVMPLYLNLPVETIAQLILPAILPFNAFKAGVNGILAWLLFDRLQKIFSL